MNYFAFQPSDSNDDAAKLTCTTTIGDDNKHSVR